MFIPKPEYPYPSKKIIIFSGAGLDAPSGIRTFRDANGLWNEHKIEDVCTERTWKKNFELVHNFYNERRKELKDVEPNYAHKVITEIINKYGKENVYNITMNVSDMFERLNTEVLHVHGELIKMECSHCYHNWNIDYNSFDITKDRCPECSSLKSVRPKIVFFGGPAPLYSYLNRAFSHAINKDSIVIVIGTQGNVVDVEDLLLGTKCKKILCNMEESEDIDVDLIKFNEVYYENIETSIDKVFQFIKNNWEV